MMKTFRYFLAVTAMLSAAFYLYSKEAPPIFNETLVKEVVAIYGFDEAKIEVLKSESHKKRSQSKILEIKAGDHFSKVSLGVLKPGVDLDADFFEQLDKAIENPELGMTKVKVGDELEIYHGYQFGGKAGDIFSCFGRWTGSDEAMIVSLSFSPENDDVKKGPPKDSFAMTLDQSTVQEKLQATMVVLFKHALPHLKANAKK